MCGRYASVLPAERLAQIFAATPPAATPGPRWNLTPGQEAPVVRHDPRAGVRKLDLLRWGLVPHWVRDPHAGRHPINARAETAATAPMFRDAFARRRALIPAQAFYEWRRTENGAKQPFAIARRDGETLAFAGLWEGWRSLEGEVLRSFAIIVTAANATMAPIHDLICTTRVKLR
jgi:putative SOS response-associated peptidase YedK